MKSGTRALMNGRLCHVYLKKPHSGNPVSKITLVEDSLNRPLLEFNDRLDDGEALSRGQIKRFFSAELRDRQRGRSVRNSPINSEAIERLLSEVTAHGRREVEDFAGTNSMRVEGAVPTEAQYLPASELLRLQRARNLSYIDSYVVHISRCCNR
jgi:hypothetical protein